MFKSVISILYHFEVPQQRYLFAINSHFAEPRCDVCDLSSKMYDTLLQLLSKVRWLKRKVITSLRYKTRQCYTTLPLESVASFTQGTDNAIDTTNLAEGLRIVY